MAVVDVGSELIVEVLIVWIIGMDDKVLGSFWSNLWFLRAIVDSRVKSNWWGLNGTWLVVFILGYVYGFSWMVLFDIVTFFVVHFQDWLIKCFNFRYA